MSTPDQGVTTSGCGWAANVLVVPSGAIDGDIEPSRKNHDVGFPSAPRRGVGPDEVTAAPAGLPAGGRSSLMSPQAVDSALLRWDRKDTKVPQ